LRGDLIVRKRTSGGEIHFGRQTADDICPKTERIANGYTLYHPDQSAIRTIVCPHNRLTLFNLGEAYGIMHLGVGYEASLMPSAAPVWNGYFLEVVSTRSCGLATARMPLDLVAQLCLVARHRLS